ncbi:ADP-ribosylation factor-like protein 13B [Hetaerina americana]|uniref:ADP-ribosylation factor-like protein 13B n=1 Tax=Hetaerina americana TaxID=62018 RepID=UPI003A7F140E
MGNISCIYDCISRYISRPSQKKVVLLLLGLENAGKTTVAKGLAHELENGVVPTVGFSSVTLEYKKLTVVLYDLGGGPGIRPIWQRYFVDAHGLIFVLDSSDIEKVTECRDVLKNLLSDDKLSGKPLLVLGNKQDVEGALDEIDLVEMLHLEDLVNQQKCPTLVETCSAIKLTKSHFKEDQVIQNSFKWLLSLIERNYDDLNNRVERDMLSQKEKDQADFNEKLKRVKEARLSREGIDEGCSEDLPRLENDEIRKGNHTSPFKPINEILNSQNDIPGKSEGGDAATNFSNSLEADKSTGSRKKRLHRQNGISEEVGGIPPRGRDMFNCCCNDSSGSSKANLLKSPKHTSARSFNIRRNNKTGPMVSGDCRDGNRESSEQVWAVRLPSSAHSREENGIVSVPEAFTVYPPQENTVELEEFTGMRSGAFQTMKG